MACSWQFCPSCGATEEIAMCTELPAAAHTLQNLIKRELFLAVGSIGETFHKIIPSSVLNKGYDNSPSTSGFLGKLDDILPAVCFP